VFLQEMSYYGAKQKGRLRGLFALDPWKRPLLQRPQEAAPPDSSVAHWVRSYIRQRQTYPA
jgi:hypothetical protein